MLSVNKCHTIFFVWTYDPDVVTIDGSDHTWKVPNFIKLSLDISQVLGNDRKCRFCFAIALETSWTTVHAASTETVNKSPIILWTTLTLEGTILYATKLLFFVKPCFSTEIIVIILLDGQSLILFYHVYRYVYKMHIFSISQSRVHELFRSLFNIFFIIYIHCCNLSSNTDCYY